MQIIFALLGGLVFGIGLILSGMTNPAKVTGFLDLAGNWDPSLAFVMAGAVAVSLFAFRIAGKRSASFLGAPACPPVSKQIDRRLVLGSLIFGIGWGMAGICPGPALVNLGSGMPGAISFVIAMLAGMVAFELFRRMPVRP